MKPKKIIIPFVLIIVVSGIIFKVRSGRGFDYAGTVEATEVDLSSRVASVISSLPVKEGSPVKKDETLAVLACEDVKIDADNAESEYKRALALKAGGSIGQESFEKAKYRRDNSALKVQWCSVKSPVSGRLLYSYREQGELVAPGTKLATVADLSEVWAYIYVPHDLLAKLKPGMEVNGFLPEAGEKELPGRISVIYSEAEFTPKNVQTRKERTRLVFAVKISFPNPDETLKPGMTVEVRLPD